MGAKRAVAALLVLLSVLMAGGYIYWQNLSGPVATIPGQDMQIVVPGGASTAQIATLLEEKGLIHSDLIFRILSRYLEYDQQLKAGQYVLNTAMTPQEILEKLSRGEVHQETFWVTIPEGLRIEQVVDRLVAAGAGDEDIFFQLAAEPEPFLEEFFFLEGLPETLEYPLEGYLFPDTYEFELGASEEDIFRRLLRQMELVLLDLGYDETVNGLTTHQAVTLASIVEREAVLDEERPVIAGVFYNRLQKSWPLESCATVQYVLGEVKPVLSDADTETPSAYNTYLHQGLPPGPIAAPGRSSLAAVAFPEETDYMFFNTRRDGTGGHYFSKTLAEHNRNIDRSKENAS